MSTTLTEIKDGTYSLQFVTSQYNSPTAVFSYSSLYNCPLIRMCIRNIAGDDKKKKLAVFLFYGASHYESHEDADVTAVLNLRGANGATGETTTMHNIYYMESYAYGFACFLDMDLLKSQGYIEDGQITFEGIITIDRHVRQKRIHNFEIKDPVVGDAVLIVEGKKLYANKEFLSSGTTLFCKAAYNIKCIGLIIDDVKYDEFEQFLQCMYSSANIDKNNLESTYKLANRYTAYFLMAQCKKFHRSNADINKSIKLEYSETTEMWSPPRPVFDEDNAKVGKWLCNPDRFDDSTVVALLKRMQEAIRAVELMGTRNFEINDPVLGDAVFIVDGKKLYANKRLVSVYSSVFKSLFSPIDYNRYGYGHITEHTIDNAKYKEFEQFLQCLYLKRGIDKTNVDSVLKMAKQFEVSFLIDHCERKLGEITV